MLNTTKKNVFVYIPSSSGDVHIRIGNNIADSTVEEHRYNTTSDGGTGYYVCDDSKKYGSFKIPYLKFLVEIARGYHEIAPRVNEWTEHVQSALIPIKEAFQESDFSEIILGVYGLFR